MTPKFISLVQTSFLKSKLIYSAVYLTSQISSVPSSLFHLLSSPCQLMGNLTLYLKIILDATAPHPNLAVSPVSAYLLESDCFSPLPLPAPSCIPHLASLSGLQVLSLLLISPPTVCFQWSDPLTAWVKSCCCSQNVLKGFLSNSEYEPWSSLLGTDPYMSWPSHHLSHPLSCSSCPWISLLLPHCLPKCFGFPLRYTHYLQV